MSHTKDEWKEAKRRIAAFEIAVELIEREMES